MNICLINPPDRISRTQDDIYAFSTYTVQNLGFGYIASVLRSTGFEVDVYDCMGMNISYKEIASILREKAYQYVLITGYGYNRHNIFKLANVAKSACPDCTVVLGGYYASLSYKEIFAQASDINVCVLGEGEATIPLLMKSLMQGESLNDIQGIAFRCKSSITVTPKRPLIEDLDSIPFPFRPFASIRGYGSIITSRGCVGNCSFCSIKVHYGMNTGKAVRFRSASNVVDEMEMLIRDEKVQMINIYDDNFLFPSEQNAHRIDEMLELLEQRGLKTLFSITVRAKDVSMFEPQLTKMAEMGLVGMFIGIESFSQRQLDFFNKNTTVQDNYNAMRIARKLNIKVDIGFILLDPYATIEEIRANLQILRSTHYFKMMYEGSYLISMYSPLRPIMDTSFRKHLIDSGRYVATDEKGYHFEDSRTDIFYEYLKKWSPTIQPVHTLYYVILQAREMGDMELADALMAEKTKLATLDCEYLETICESILEGKDNICCDESVSSFKKRAKAIHDIFLKAQQRLLERRHKNGTAHKVE